jgi:hypothetical protein
MNYDLDYFIKFFEKIPSGEWCRGNLINAVGQCCSLGHLGVREGRSCGGRLEWQENEKSLALAELIRTYFKLEDISDFEIVYYINDKVSLLPVPLQELVTSTCPKTNILNVLNYMKNNPK